MSTISCGDARTLLLDAEPALLRAPDASPLGVHLRSCDACARAAAAIVAAHDDLSHAMVELAPVARTPAVPATAAIAPAAGAPAARALSWGRRARVLLRPMVPLAAAAVLLLVTGRAVLREQPSLPPILLPPERVPATVVVNAGTTGTVAVMKTSNPGITIVWHLESTQ
ncbi:MAG TPA: hypothetical protein VK928_07210 [Longimicrobiales bacterium]|nr:hypothetical protein [Longimicrobiales bacterium]